MRGHLGRPIVYRPGYNNIDITYVERTDYFVERYDHGTK